MKIEQITIQNFRNIGEAFTFSLNPNFTTFIGVNGKGKSTILHALRVACGAFFLAIPEVKSRHIYKEEVRVVESGTLLTPQFPVKIEAKGFFAGDSESITWRRQWLEGASYSSTRNSDVAAIREIALKKHNHLIKNLDDKLDLPIIAFFGISRAVGAGRLTKKSRIQRLGRQIFKEGYQDWDEMKAVKFHYEEWLGTYDVLVKQGKEYAGTKEAFFYTLKTANPFIQEIEYINGELWIKATIEEEETGLLPLSLHSDGIHYFTAMIAEIAYRCIVLNGYKKENAIKETNGIIMIDEIDLHLHPKWQRHVVSDLKRAFPNIQFIVTTHSPFIVQSLDSGELYNLDNILSDVNPKDLSIGEVTEEVMGTESVMSIENSNDEKLASKYFELLTNEKHSKNTIEAELDKIEIEISDPGLRALLKMKRLGENK